MRRGHLHAAGPARSRTSAARPARSTGGGARVDLLLASLVAAGLACHPTEALPPPPLAGASSALLIHVVEDTPAFVYAVDPAAPAWPTFARRQDSALYLARFDCDLPRLALRAGPQTLAAAAAERRVLPPPRSIATLSLREEAAASWAEVEAPTVVQDVLTRLDVPEDSVCQRVQATYTLTDQDADAPTTALVVPRFGVPVGGGAFLVGATHHPDFNETSTTGYSALRLDADGAEVWPQVEALGRPLAGLARRDGQLWLSSGRELWLGHPDTGFAVVTSTVFLPAPEVVLLAGDPDGDDLFMAVQVLIPGGVPPSYPARRGVYHLEGARWRRVLELEVARAELDELTLAWVGPGEVLATGMARVAGSILRVRDGVAAEEPFGGDTARRVQGVAGRGPMVIDLVGGLYQQGAGRTWTKLRARGPGIYADHFEPLGEDGLAIFGLVGGFGVTQYFPEVGPCESESLSPLRTGTVVRVSDTRLLVLLRSLAGGRLRFAFVDRTAPSGPECP